MKGNDNDQDMCPRCMTPLHGQRLCPKCKLDPSTYTPAKHHLPPRTILDGKYLVGCVLGEGGFGITYVGWDLQLHTMVAIKEYFPTGIVFRDNTQSNVVSVFSGTGEEYYLHDREKFLEEAQMLAKFDGNPGVVSVKNYFKENGTAYIVMEYVQGINLAVLMEQNNNKLPYDRVMKLLDLPIKTLSEMHRQNTFHRDISPENLMVTNDSVVKLIDFGSTKTNKKDKTRYLKVRPGYSPLELYTSGGQEGPYSDIYSLSATIYKAVTGITPPPATDRINDDALVPPIKAGAKGMTPAQEKALLKGLAVKAQDRYQRVEDLYAALQRGKPKSGQKPKAGGKAKRRSPAKAIAIACAAALVVALGLFLLLRGKGAKKALPEEMFREVPDIYEAYRNGGEYPFEVRAYVTPDEVFLTGSAEDWRGTEDPERREAMSKQALAETVDSLYQSGLPIETIVFRNLDFESLEPLNRPWRTPVGLIFNCCTMPDDWSALSGMGESLTVLHVEGECDLHDLSWMTSFTNLSWLALGGEEIDTASISQIESLAGFSLAGCQVDDLTPFAGMPNLANMGLMDCNVSDLSPLSEMHRLEQLYLQNNNVSDLSPLAGLENLRVLDVSNNCIADFSPVDHVAEVTGRDDQRIEISEDRRIGAYADVEPYKLGAGSFEAVPEAYEAYTGGGEYPYNLDCYISSSGLWFTRAGDVSWSDGSVRTTITGEQLATAMNAVYQSGLPVEKIILQSWKFDTLLPLARRWPSVTGVIFENCELPGDWTALADMGDSLILLDVEGGRFDASDLSWMTALNGLSDLYLVNNGDAVGDVDLDSIGQMTWLRILNIRGFGLADISPLSGLTELAALNVDSNSVTDLSPVAGMTRMEDLHFSANPVEDISALAGMTELQTLYMDDCEVKDISALADMAELRTLSMKDCEVEDIFVLTRLTKLERVELDRNHIADLRPVDHVRIVSGRYSQILGDDTGSEPEPEPEPVEAPWWESVEAYPLREEMFGEVPIIWEQYNSEDRSYWYNVRATITPTDGLRLSRTASNGRGLIYLDGFEGDYEALNAQQLASVLNAVADLPVAEIVLQGWRLETLEPLGRHWPRGVAVYIDHCELPDDWPGIFENLGDSLNALWIKGDFNAQDLGLLVCCPNLTELYLGGDYYSKSDPCMVDFEAICGQTQLRHLDLQGWGISDLSPIGSLANLEFLGVPVNHVTDLSPLAALTNLTFLNIDENSVTDLSPLAALENLNGLYAKSNRIADLSPLRQLSNLEEAELDGNYISNFSPVDHVARVTGRDMQVSEAAFADIPDIYQAFMNGEEINDEQLQIVIDPNGMRFQRIPEDNSYLLTEAIEQGGNMTLEMLDRYMSLIDRLEQRGLPLRRAVFLRWDWLAANVDAFNNDWLYLRELEFDECMMPEGQDEALDWGGIAAMGELLERLEVYGAFDCEHLDWLANCPNLFCLRLDAGDHEHIDDHGLEVIGGMTQLIDLRLSHMGVNRIDALSNLTNLASLDVSDNNLDNLEPVANMPALTSLSAHGNQIKDLSPLAGLSNLQYLFLDNNQVEDLSPLSGLTNLVMLEVGGNSISDVAPLQNLTNLSNLSLHDNFITDLSPIANLTNLTNLDLTNNIIYDVSPLGGLRGLEHLYLGGNHIGSAEPVRFVPELGGADDQQVIITRDTFAACPDVYSALCGALGLGEGSDIDPADYDYGDFNVVIRSDEVRFILRDDEPLWESYQHDDEPRKPISEKRLAAVMDALCASKLPIACYSFDHCGFATLRPIARDYLWTPWFYFSNCDWPLDAIESIGGIGSNLFWLYAEDLPCGDLNWLAGHPELHGVQLCYSDTEHSALADASALAEMTQIEYLDLYNTSLSNISFVGGMSNLNRLSVPDSYVSDLWPLAGKDHFVYLDVRNTNITDISALATLPNLEGVELNGCNISDYSPVDHVANVQGRP